MVITSNISASEAAAIRGEFQNLDATIGELNDHPVLTFARRDSTTIGPVTCIKVKLDKIQQLTTGIGTAATGTEQTGTIKATASEFSAPVQQGDRFVWNGQKCRVANGPAPKWYGSTVVIGFVLEQGNGG